MLNNWYLFKSTDNERDVEYIHTIEKDKNGIFETYVEGKDLAFAIIEDIERNKLILKWDDMNNGSLSVPTLNEMTNYILELEQNGEVERVLVFKQTDPEQFPPFMFDNSNPKEE